MEATPCGITTLLRDEQPKNAAVSIFFKPPGSLISVSALQRLNAPLPISVSVSGNVTLCRSA